MNIFFGAAIQGHTKRGERAIFYRHVLESIKSGGHKLFAEHTGALTREENLRLLEDAIGKLPEDDLARRTFIRNKMIEAIESPSLDAAIFEVSTPSLGTGVELAHAYLRARMGLRAIPILVLYQKNYWPHHLSTMIRGLTPQSAPTVKIVDYEDLHELGLQVNSFLLNISKPILIPRSVGF